jgi:hypothetical protein
MISLRQTLTAIGLLFDFLSVLTIVKWAGFLSYKSWKERYIEKKGELLRAVYQRDRKAVSFLLTFLLIGTILQMIGILLQLDFYKILSPS